MNANEVSAARTEAQESTVARIIKRFLKYTDTLEQIISELAYRDWAASRCYASVSRAMLVEAMCRSIKVLRRPAEAATPEEVSSAARQFVRKISGFPKPSKANEESFERAVREIAASSDRLLKEIGSSSLKRK